MKNLYLLFILFLAGAFSLHSQAVPADDPLSEYAHLWENTKKKKDKKTKKDKKNTKSSKQSKQTAQNTSDATSKSSSKDEKTNTPSSSQLGDDDLPVEDFRGGLPFDGGSNTFEGGLTYTNIDGESFIGLSLSPEFKIGKVGVGINVPLLYSLEEGSFRTEIFKDGVGVARLVRYVRYGTQKQDPVYVKVGELNNLMIGFGGLVNNYTNSTSFEKRKVGIHYDINYKGLVGIEGMYSDFDPSGLNLFVIRPYTRPLSNLPIPIVKTLEIGLTFIKDKDQTEIPTSDSTFVTNTFTEPGIGAFGIDAGVTVLRTKFLQIDAFMNYSKLKISSKVLTDSLTAIYDLDANNLPLLSDGFENASGFSFGVNFRLHFIADIFSTDVRIERLTYGEHFLPQFFDTSYELGKDSKILSLANAEASSGIYGSITGHILQKIIIGGSLMIPDNISETSPAVVRINADMDRLADKFSMHASYVKGGLTSLGEAFSFDDRSLAKVRLVYHINKFLATGLDYYWAFAQVSDGSYKATKYVSPYFGLNIKF